MSIDPVSSFSSTPHFSPATQTGDRVQADSSDTPPRILRTSSGLSSMTASIASSSTLVVTPTIGTSPPRKRKELKDPSQPPTSPIESVGPEDSPLQKKSHFSPFETPASGLSDSDGDPTSSPSLGTSSDSGTGGGGAGVPTPTFMASPLRKPSHRSSFATPTPPSSSSASSDTAVLQTPPRGSPGGGGNPLLESPGLLASPIVIGKGSENHYADKIPFMRAKVAKKMKNKEFHTVAPAHAAKLERILLLHIDEIRSVWKVLKRTRDDTPKEINKGTATILVRLNCDIEVTDLIGGKPTRTLFGWHAFIEKDGSRGAVPHPVGGDDVYTLPGSAFHAVEESHGWRARPEDLSPYAVVVPRPRSSSSRFLASLASSDRSLSPGSGISLTASSPSPSLSPISDSDRSLSPESGISLTENSPSPVLGTGLSSPVNLSTPSAPVLRSLFSPIKA